MMYECAQVLSPGLIRKIYICIYNIYIYIYIYMYIYIDIDIYSNANFKCVTSNIFE